MLQLEMAKKAVSKPTYKILMWMFSTLCLSGLLWQGFQISTIYFKFDVITSIKIIMPETIAPRTNYLNLCIFQFEAQNKTEFSKLRRKYDKYVNVKFENITQQIINNMTLRERLQIAHRGEKIFSSNTNFTISEFLQNSFYCYQLGNMKFGKYYFSDQKVLSSVRYWLVSSSFKFPNFDFRRTEVVPSSRDMSRPALVHVESYSFFIFKLGWPHTDDCIDYESHGFIDQYDALRKCINIITLRDKEMVYGGMSLTRNHTHYLDYRLSPVIYSDNNPIDECKRKFLSHSDCRKETIISQVSKQDAPDKDKYPNTIHFTMSECNSPSFEIESKPKIDHIEYFTYILGAFGSWLGISFLSFNPVPYLLKMRDKSKKLVGETVVLPQYSYITLLSYLRSQNKRIRRIEQLIHE